MTWTSEVTDGRTHDVGDSPGRSDATGGKVSCRTVPADRRLARLLRPAMVAGRPDRRGHRRGTDRPEEPGLRRDRRNPSAEWALRCSSGGDPLRGVRNVTPDLDGTQ